MYELARYDGETMTQVSKGRLPLQAYRNATEHYRSTLLLRKQTYATLRHDSGEVENGLKDYVYLLWS
jgi:hypothetical protein